MRLFPQSLGFARGDTMTAKQFSSWWQKNRKWLGYLGLTIVGLLVVVLVIIVSVVNGTGFDKTLTNVIVSQATTTSRTTDTTIKQYQQGKTLWDWLGLLGTFAIPFAVVWFTVRLSHDRQIAVDSQRETELLSIIRATPDLNKLKANLNLEHPTRKQIIIRAQTLALLPSLDANRKATLLKFLYELNLIGYLPGEHPEPAAIELSSADLRGANLADAVLNGADLTNTRLGGANLRGAKLTRANLNGADLRKADLRKADLSGASLVGAILDSADLKDAIVTPEQLKTAKSP
jgi:hypothetical protein